MRYMIQSISFLLIMTLPLWNGYRLDIDNNKLYLFGFELGYHSGYLFALFTLIFVLSLMGFSMLWSRFFCKWGCPHNTLTSFLTRLEARYGTKGKGAIMGLSIVMSVVMAYSTVSFFYNPVAVFDSLLHLKMNKHFWLVLSVSSLYSTLTFHARSSFCKVCPYGIAQELSFIQAIRASDRFLHPGLWVTWGTTLVLLLILIAGW